MNVPGRAEGNWRWRCTEEMLLPACLRMAARPDEDLGPLEFSLCEAAEPRRTRVLEDVAMKATTRYCRNAQSSPAGGRARLWCPS